MNFEKDFEKLVELYHLIQNETANLNNSESKLDQMCNDFVKKHTIENEALKVDMEVRKPRKKKRVQTSPDSRFVDIEAIEKSRGIKIASPVESEDEEDQESEVSCIIVKW